jgi:hypothetical protein
MLVDTKPENALYKFIISRNILPIWRENDGPTTLHTRSLIFSKRVSSFTVAGFFKLSKFSVAALTMLHRSQQAQTAKAWAPIRTLVPHQK